MNYEYGGSLVPFQGTHSPRQTVKPRNLTVRIAGNTAEIQTGYLPNTWIHVWRIRAKSPWSISKGISVWNIYIIIIILWLCRVY